MMDIDDLEDDHEGISFSTYSLNHNPSSFAFPRKSRSRDPQFSRHNPNFHTHDHEESDDPVDDGGFYAVPKKKRRTAKAFVTVNDHPNPSLEDSKLGFEENWSERAIFKLLEIWGERFLEAGRRGLMAEEWRDVAERVSEVSRLERTEAQCRSMLDSLMRKYKKEKDRIRISKSQSCSSNWGYFRKMEALLDSSSTASAASRGGGLACGVDSGEFVFADTTVYLEQANGHDEMRDSPSESEAWSDDGDGNGSDSSGNGEESNGGGSMKVLADSIERFAEIHGRVERDKRKQMMELERMRRDLKMELESQKRLIMERTKAAIAKIQNDDQDEDEDEDYDLTE